MAAIDKPELAPDLFREDLMKFGLLADELRRFHESRTLECRSLTLRKLMQGAKKFTARMVRIWRDKLVNAFMFG